MDIILKYTNSSGTEKNIQIIFEVLMLNEESIQHEANKKDGRN